MLRSPLARRALTLALLTSATLPAAAATRVEIEGARSYMDSHGTNAAFVEAVFEPQPLGENFTWSPDISAGWIDGRDLSRYAHSDYGTHHSVALLAGGARLHFSNDSAWYQPLFFSFQVAGTNRTTMALSSHYQFVSTLGWQAHHFTVAIRHISNGSFQGPNRGETMGLVGVGFDF